MGLLVSVSALEQGDAGALRRGEESPREPAGPGRQTRRHLGHLRASAEGAEEDRALSPRQAPRKPALARALAHRDSFSSGHGVIIASDEVSKEHDLPLVRW